MKQVERTEQGNPVKQVLEVVGFIALVQGGVGLVHELTGRLVDWGIVQRLGFLDGYEVYASVALLVLAFAMFAAAESRKSG
jgi:hypothetical protein